MTVAQPSVSTAGSLRISDVARGHALHADRERDRHDRGQSLGHGRDRQRDGGQEAPRASAARGEDRSPPRSPTIAETDEEQGPADRREALLKRRLALLVPSSSRWAILPELRPHARGDDLGDAGAGRDRRPHEHRVAALGQGGIRRRGRRALLDRARSRRSAAPRSSRARAPRAGARRRRRCRRPRAGAGRPVRRRPAEIVVAWPSRSTRARGAVIERSASIAFSARYSWKKPTSALMHDDRADRDRVGDLAEDAGQDRGTEQQPDERAAELGGENLPRRRGGAARDLVRTDLAQAPLCLPGRESGGAGVGRADLMRRRDHLHGGPQSNG